MASTAVFIAAKSREAGSPAEGRDLASRGRIEGLGQPVTATCRARHPAGRGRRRSRWRRRRRNVELRLGQPGRLRAQPGRGADGIGPILTCVLKGTSAKLVFALPVALWIVSMRFLAASFSTSSLTDAAHRAGVVEHERNFHAHDAERHLGAGIEGNEHAGRGSRRRSSVASRRPRPRSAPSSP